MGKRVFLIVIDSAGIGNAPDAAAFNDAGADTFGSLVRSGALDIPVMTKMGFYNIEATSFRDPKPDVTGCYARLVERSNGKDTTVGHWEIAGVVSPSPMPVYPDGFPKEVMEAFEKAVGRKALCNLPYSGTEVIKDYGREAIETGAYIVYTSADSVFQIAAHEEVIPIDELYDACHKAREILKGEHGVGRVIARPFTGEWPYERTVRRHDYSLEPPKETILDAMKKNGLDVIGVGKIHDIFAGRGLTETYPNEGNEKNMERTIALADTDFTGLCFVNLVDTDATYGHRRDIPGYTASVNATDRALAALIPKLQPEDILMVTADHGCDPGYSGTDHTRECVPLLICGAPLKENVDLGSVTGFGCIAKTIADYFNIDFDGEGRSLLPIINK